MTDCVIYGPEIINIYKWESLSQKKTSVFTRAYSFYELLHFQLKKVVSVFKVYHMISLNTGTLVVSMHEYFCINLSPKTLEK